MEAFTELKSIHSFSEEETYPGVDAAPAKLQHRGIRGTFQSKCGPERSAGEESAVPSLWKPLTPVQSQVNHRGSCPQAGSGPHHLLSCSAVQEVKD